jgi:glycosyltransferase involved in cell wall biosynthesis
MEAASMEVPIITSRTTGCREVVEDGHNGYLCAVNDVGDLVRKMEIMMALSSSERAEMGKKGRALVIEKFDVQKILIEYDKTLQQLVTLS